MTVSDIVRMGREMLKLLSENDVKIDDWKYLKMYDEYKRMRESGIKYRATIAELSTIHHISTSKVERIVRRLSKSVK